MSLICLWFDVDDEEKQKRCYLVSTLKRIRTGQSIKWCLSLELELAFAFAFNIQNKEGDGDGGPSTVVDRSNVWQLGGAMLRNTIELVCLLKEKYIKNGLICV